MNSRYSKKKNKQKLHDAIQKVTDKELLKIIIFHFRVCF